MSRCHESSRPGFGDVWSALAAPAADEQGLALEEERLPQRVRVQQKPVAL